MIKQVNHGKDDPGKIHQEVFPRKPIMLSIAPGLMGNMDDIITKGQSSFLPQSPSPTPKALCQVSKM